jgi:signal transduction histidine kinase
MHPRLSTLPSSRLSLSARLLLWTVVFVMVAEVLIYVPSIARYRKMYLHERIASAHLATLALHASPTGRVSPKLEQMLLDHAQALAIELWHPEAELMLGALPPADADFDLADRSPAHLVREAFATLAAGGERVIRIQGLAPPADHSHDPAIMRVEVYFDEGPLYAGMVDYSWRILQLSIVISLITAALLYLALQWQMVRPMRRITRNLVAYRESPEDPARVIVPSPRRDEIGVMERELARMQGELRLSLARKNRLAALGTAVSKINHDLRGLLNTVQLVSERLVRLEDPSVKKVSPMLVSAVDRAVQLCTQTLDLARGDAAIPNTGRFALRPLLDEVGQSLALGNGDGVVWDNRVPADLAVDADRERLYRVFHNLGRNAAQALGGQGRIRLLAHNSGGQVLIEVSDDGPGIPKGTREHLFEPFAGSGRTGGTGLGLATARDLVRGHGGELSLVDTSSAGTTFRITLPGHPPVEDPETAHRP